MTDLKKKATLLFSILFILTIICILLSAWLVITEVNLLLILSMLVIDFIVFCSLLTIIFTAYFYKKRMQKFAEEEKQKKTD